MVSKKYPLPAFLEGRVTIETYEKWLEKRGNQVYIRDLKRKKPYALNSSVSFYKGKIHKAVTERGSVDPYTGEPLKWELIGIGYNLKPEKMLGAFNKEFYLLPTVDHIDPEAKELELEICSWLVNTCKNLLNPSDFLDLCKKIVAYRGG
jgi:hypothetical protein